MNPDAAEEATRAAAAESEFGESIDSEVEDSVPDTSAEAVPETPAEPEDGCLSLAGTRTARRWDCIKVRWQNERFQQRLKTFTGRTAQIIQHEIDHCEGILI